MTNWHDAAIITLASCRCGCSSSGRAPPCQGGGSEFEPRHPLQLRSSHHRSDSAVRRERTLMGIFLFPETRFASAFLSRRDGALHGCNRAPLFGGLGRAVRIQPAWMRAHRRSHGRESAGEYTVFVFAAACCDGKNFCKHHKACEAHAPVSVRQLFRTAKDRRPDSAGLAGMMLAFQRMIVFPQGRRAMRLGCGSTERHG